MQVENRGLFANNLKRERSRPPKQQRVSVLFSDYLQKAPGFPPGCVHTLSTSLILVENTINYGMQNLFRFVIGKMCPL